MSGTTAVTALIRGRELYIANVGDSRAVLAVRNADSSLVAHALTVDQTPFRKDECERVRAEGARVMTLDQLEGLKVSRCSTSCCWSRATVMRGFRVTAGPQWSRAWRAYGVAPAALCAAMDRSAVESVQTCSVDTAPYDALPNAAVQDPDVDYWGSEEQNGGDPPRLWFPNAMLPGTAFTRSIGDSTAERIGVMADPETLKRDLTPKDGMLILASDGIFEFMSNQTVVDMIDRFDDLHEACMSVVAEAHRWVRMDG